MEVLNAIEEIVHGHTRPQSGTETVVLWDENVLIKEEKVLSTCLATLLETEQKQEELLDEAKKRHNRVKSQISELHFSRFLREQKFPILNIEPLRWRLESGLPKLALFESNSTYCQFCSYIHYGFSQPHFPNEYQGVWDDVKDQMSAELKKIRQPWVRLPWFLSIGIILILLALGSIPLTFGDSANPSWLFITVAVSGVVFSLFGAFGLNKLCKRESLRYKVDFKGLIPSKAREVIKRIIEAGGKVYFLAEVGEWGIEIRTDPIILTCDENHFYVAGRFNTTSLEEYVKNEFSELPLE